MLSSILKPSRPLVYVCQRHASRSNRSISLRKFSKPEVYKGQWVPVQPEPTSASEVDAPSSVTAKDGDKASDIDVARFEKAEEEHRQRAEELLVKREDDRKARQKDFKMRKKLRLLAQKEAAATAEEAAANPELASETATGPNDGVKVAAVKPPKFKAVRLMLTPIRRKESDEDENPSKESLDNPPQTAEKPYRTPKRKEEPDERDESVRRKERPPGLSRWLYLGNIPTELLENRNEVIEKFKGFGTLLNVRIPSDIGDDPRGYMHIEYLRQQDADACYWELTERPVHLYGRRLRVDYTRHGDTNASADTEIGSDRATTKYPINELTVFLSGIPEELHKDPWRLMDILSKYGEISDMRIAQTPKLPANSVFIDFLRPDEALKCIEAVNLYKIEGWPERVQAKYGLQYPQPVMTEEVQPLSDTLQIWPVPLRAVSDELMLREAFGDNAKLLDIRINRKNDWPTATIFLQYATVKDAQEVFEWIRSDPDNPVSFFGRNVLANYARPWVDHLRKIDKPPKGESKREVAVDKSWALGRSGSEKRPRGKRNPWKIQTHDD